MGLHPTCGLMSLEKGSKLMAFMDMILGLIGIVWFVFMLGKYDIVSLDAFENPAGAGNNSRISKLDEFPDDTTTRKLSKNHKIIGLTLSGFFTTVNLLLFVILLVGIHKKHVGLCLTWFYIRCSVIVFKLIIFVMYLIAGRPLFSQIPFILFMVIHAYGLWVVNNYIEELRAHQLEARNSQSYQKGGRAPSITAENGIERLEKKRKEWYEDHSTTTTNTTPTTTGGGGEKGEGNTLTCVLSSPYFGLGTSLN